MSEPTPPQLPPQPFAPTPRPTSSGCGKAALVGCGVLLLLLGIGAVVFVVKAKELLGWSMRRMQEQILSRLPDDVTEAERERLERAFAAAGRKATAGEIDPVALQRLQREMVSLTQGELTRERVLEVTATLEEIAGTTAPDGSESPPAEAPPAETAPEEVGSPPPSADVDTPLAA
jgi:hypothetical protein